MNGLQNLRKRTSTVKTDITKLTRDNFSSPELRAKYFRANNISLDRLHLPEISAEQYEEIAKGFDNPKFDKANLKLETASSYYIKKARVAMLAQDLGVSPNTLDSSNYIWSEDYYIHPSFLVNLNIAEDLFRERGDDWRELSANTIYIKQDYKSTALDDELWKALYKFCYDAIVKRKAMLLNKVPQCLSFLMSVLEQSNGLTENVTAGQHATLSSYAEFFIDLLGDKEFKEFYVNHTDVDIFGEYEATSKDYVETYRTMLRQLIRCSGDELEYFRATLEEVEDSNIESILEKTLDPEDFLSESYIRNEGDEEFED